MIYLGVRDVKSARKDHQCDFCLNRILKGDGYSRWTHVYHTELYCTKQCMVCIAFATDYPEEAKECYSNEYNFTELEHYNEFAANFAIDRLLT